MECIAELHDFLLHAMSAYQNLAPKELRCILLQSAERILPEVDQVLAEFAQRILERRGIEIQLNVRLNAVSADAVIVQPKGANHCESRSVAFWRRRNDRPRRFDPRTVDRIDRRTEGRQPDPRRLIAIGSPLLNELVSPSRNRERPWCHAPCC